MDLSQDSPSSFIVRGFGELKSIQDLERVSGFAEAFGLSGLLQIQDTKHSASAVAAGDGLPLTGVVETTLRRDNATSADSRSSRGSETTLFPRL